VINTVSVLDDCSDWMKLGESDQVFGWSVSVKKITLHSNVRWPGCARRARISSGEVVRFVSFCQ